jgi:lambda family phage portal protein
MSITWQAPGTRATAFVPAKREAIAAGAPWYNADRVRQAGSVVLREWNHQRSAARQAAMNPQQRLYAAARLDRLNADWTVVGTSADTEIATSLRTLRARSRALIRDNDYAKNAVRIITNNVIGTGIGLQALVQTSRGRLVDNVNSQIEDAWATWSQAKSCHTAGKLGWADIERLCIRQLVENGEFILRKIRQPFGDSQIPLAVEVIEADRLLDNWSGHNAPNGNVIRMGVEMDQWMRPQAYWFHPNHPGDFQFTVFDPARFIRVPADEIEHHFLIERWPQARGVPWFHTAILRLHNMGGYEEAEIIAARASAAVMGIIQAPEAIAPDAVVDQQRVMNMQPGMMLQLLPGEQFEGFNPSRPNTGMDAFMRLMLRGVASGVGVSYESLSRDYSQSNYSSSRLALLDDRDLWRVLQGWFIANVRVPLHNEWLQAAIMAGQVRADDYFTNKAKYQNVRFKPRGWQWIDPTKEVNAFKIAVRAGFMTVADVIAQTGGGQDAEDVFKARRQELDMMAEQDLVFDTDPAQVDEKGIVQATPVPEETEDGPAKGETSAEDANESAGDGAQQ